MSRRNNLKKRRQHHAAMLKEERIREALAKKRQDRRISGKEKAAADTELAGALEKVVHLEEVKTTVIPRIGAPLPSDDGDAKMGISRVGSGRIRKKKKDVERQKKIRKRMMERAAMLM